MTWLLGGASLSLWVSVACTVSVRRVDAKGWSPEVVEAAIKACSDGFDSGKDSQEEGRRSCECIVDAVRVRWAYEEFSKQMASLQTDSEFKAISNRCKSAARTAHPAGG
jgi:hypothetical protein